MPVRKTWIGYALEPSSHANFINLSSIWTAMFTPFFHCQNHLHVLYVLYYVTCFILCYADSFYIFLSFF